MKKLLFGAFAVMPRGGRAGARAGRSARARQHRRRVHGARVGRVGSVRHRRRVQRSASSSSRRRRRAFGIQVEYGYNSLGGEDTTIPLFATPTAIATGEALIESHHYMHYFDFNGILQTPATSRGHAVRALAASACTTGASA